MIVFRYGIDMSLISPDHPRRKDGLSSAIVARKIAFLRSEVKNKTPYLSPYTKLSSKWSKNLNLHPDTMQLLE